MLAFMDHRFQQCLLLRLGIFDFAIASSLPFKFTRDILAYYAYSEHAYICAAALQVI